MVAHPPRPPRPGAPHSPPGRPGSATHAGDDALITACETAFATMWGRSADALPPYVDRTNVVATYARSVAMLLRATGEAPSLAARLEGVAAELMRGAPSLAPTPGQRD